MSGKRAIQKRSKAESPKRRRLGFDFRLGEGSGLALVVSGAASFAGALAGTAGGSPTRRYLDRMFRLSPGDGPETAAAPAGGSGVGAGGVATAAAGVTGGGERFDVSCLRPGATRDFLRARYRGPKPQYAIAEHTGIPADTIRKALQANNPSEISGPHLMRLVSVFGPPFLAAVLDPVPVWVRAWCDAEAGP